MKETEVRDQAAAEGRKTYAGRPCKHGHDGERYVVNMTCVHCARNAARERQRRQRQELADNTAEGV